jgi:hypothetical protein
VFNKTLSLHPDTEVGISRLQCIGKIVYRLAKSR